MVLRVACPEENGIVPAHKTEDLEKHHVQPFRFEHGAVTELVESVQQERVAGSVQEQGHEQERERKMFRCIPGEGAREGERAKVTQGLQKPLEVAASIQRVQRLPVQGTPVPIDFTFAPCVHITIRLIPKHADAQAATPTSAPRLSRSALACRHAIPQHPDTGDLDLHTVTRLHEGSGGRAHSGNGSGTDQIARFEGDYGGNVLNNHIDRI